MSELTRDKLQGPESESQAQKKELTIKDLYDQGSKCCQQYSVLTMQIRTLAQYILVAYTVGISIAISRVPSPDPKSPSQDLYQILAVAGAVVGCFAVVLGILNHHYSTAFNEIRDLCLVALEKDVLPPEKVEVENVSITAKFVALFKKEPQREIAKPIGPWQAQQNVRRRQTIMRRLSWYLPFVVLFVFGLIGVFIGRNWWPFTR